MASPSATADKFMLRLPDGMRDRLAAAAKTNGRSMNAEVVWRLERSLASISPIGTLAEEVAGLRRRVDALEMRGAI